MPAFHASVFRIATLAGAIALAACQPRQEAAAPAAASPAPATSAPATSAPATPAPMADAPAPAPDATQPLATTWQCGDLRVGAAFDNAAGRVVLSYSGRERVLPLARSGSGARYADEAGNEFWTKGDSGMLTLDGQKHDCTLTRQASPWDEARARNVAFRAVGNEPGWLVEIGPGATPTLHAQLDFGSRTLDIAQVQRRSDGDGWSGRTADGTRVDLQVLRTPCQDDSGATHEATARLATGGKTYAGCGAFLAGER